VRRGESPAWFSKRRREEVWWGGVSSHTAVIWNKSKELIMQGKGQKLTKQKNSPGEGERESVF